MLLQIVGAPSAKHLTRAQILIGGQLRSALQR